MQQARIQIIVAALFFTVIAGLLLIRRFDTQPEEPVVIVSVSGSERKVGEKLRRGEIIETKVGEYLALQIGESVLVGIDERSRVELYRLFADERILRFPRGRIVIESQDKKPFLIETNKTQSIVENGSATFINYDYQQLVTIAPIKGSIQTHIKNTNEYILLPVPINVSEKNSPTYLAATTDPLSGAKKFYEWFFGI